MICTQLNETQKKFHYLFLALRRSDSAARPCRLAVDADTEAEARKCLAPEFILSFAGRVPARGVAHV